MRAKGGRESLLYGEKLEGGGASEGKENAKARGKDKSRIKKEVRDIDT